MPTAISTGAKNKNMQASTPYYLVCTSSCNEREQEENKINDNKKRRKKQEKTTGNKEGYIYLFEIKELHSSCNKIEDFVETHISKLCMCDTAVSSRLFFLRYSVDRNNGITSRGGQCCHPGASRTV